MRKNKPAPTLSKSKIIAFRQCPKRLWLEVHRPDLRVDSAATEARFQVGHQVGEIARQLYDPAGDGVRMNIARDGFKAVFEQSRRLLDAGDRPVFEAGFKSSNTIAFADMMIPATDGTRVAWKMVEVKSSTSVKDYHRDDAAVQSFLARAMGVPLSSVSVACINSSWVYPGGNDYRGLLAETDLTGETLERSHEVSSWISKAHQIAASDTEPVVEPGDQCGTPFECGFCGYCKRNQAAPEYPLDWLPRVSPNQRASFKEAGAQDMRDVPESLLGPKQRLVRNHTLRGSLFFDRKAAAKSLRGGGSPAYFLDFETCSMPVPIWTGTRPYQQIPFQFSLHKVACALEHTPFLDLSGQDPSRPFAEAVIEACGTRGPIFVYNASFEKWILKELAARFSDLAPGLDGIIARVIDLLPIAKECFYHPSQCGSWSIKSVLPAAVPELSYEQLEGIRDGGMAMAAFAEAIHPETSPVRKEEIHRQLLAYCHLDTLAMVGLWKLFSGRNHPRLA
jgi:hypothetical protein